MVLNSTFNYIFFYYIMAVSEFESRLWRDVLDTTLCDNVFQKRAMGRWFYPGTPFYSINNTDRHNDFYINNKIILQ
jgi:hypothetical protein